MNKLNHMPTKGQLHKLAILLHDTSVPLEKRYEAFELLLSHGFLKASVVSAIDIIHTYKLATQ